MINYRPCEYTIELILTLKESLVLCKVIDNINKLSIDAIEIEIEYSSSNSTINEKRVNCTITGRGITGMNLVTNIINKLCNNELTEPLQ